MKAPPATQANTTSTSHLTKPPPSCDERFLKLFCAALTGVAGQYEQSIPGALAGVRTSGGADARERELSLRAWRLARHAFEFFEIEQAIWRHELPPIATDEDPCEAFASKLNEADSKKAGNVSHGKHLRTLRFQLNEAD
jgi:hypothetical protein